VSAAVELCRDDDRGRHQPYQHNLNDSCRKFRGVVGVQTVIGDQALAFVRQRHGLVNGDIGRIQRQQQFLGAVFRKATSSGVLFDPVRFTRLLGAFAGALTLDQNTSIIDLEHLALRLKGLNPADLRFETLPQRSPSPTDTSLGDVFTDSAGILEIMPTGQSQSVGSVQIIVQPAFQAMIAGLKGVPTASPVNGRRTPPPATSATRTAPAASASAAVPQAAAPATQSPAANIPVDAASPSNRCTY
jgi:anionic cell wall polymer biosynthesis LytR-Cps2A-Psr (LCP) family protein